MAVRFNNTGGKYLRRTTDLPSVDNWAIAMWVQLVSDLNAYTPFFYRTANSIAIYCFFGTSADGTTLLLDVNANSTTGSSLTVGTWYHLLLQGWTSGGLKSFEYYLDGTAGATVGPINFSWSNDEVTLGLTDSTDNLPSDTRIAYVKMWSAAGVAKLFTSAEQVQQEMRTARPQNFTNLYLWSPLLVNSKDYSGSARDWTEGGTLTWEDGPPVGWGASPLIVGGAGGGDVFVPPPYLPGLGFSAQQRMG